MVSHSLHRKEINYLQERCVVLEAQVEQHISTEESYENQIHALQQSVENLENQLRAVTEEKVRKMNCNYLNVVV